MNRLDPDEGPGGKAKRAWQRMSSTGKDEFQQLYGAWDSMSTDVRLSNLSSYFSKLRREKRDAEIKAIVEPIMQYIKDQQQVSNQERLDLRREIKALGDAAASANERRLEERLRETTSSRRDNQYAQPPSAPPTSFSVPPTPIARDCVYDKNGPKGVIVVTATNDGIYGTCMVAQQVNARRLGPLVLTSMLERLGCPSNKVIRTCEYLENAKVRIS